MVLPLDEGDGLRAEQSPAPTVIWVEGVVVKGLWVGD